MAALHDHPLALWLSSNKLGVGLGMAMAALLGLSSLMVPDPRGKDALPFSETIVLFFDPVSVDYWWFYALLLVTAAYGVIATVGTWRSIAQRLEGRGLDRRFWGVTLMHLGFLGGLVAHLAAGISVDVEQAGTLGPQPIELAGRQLRLLDVREVHNPDGTLRTLSSTVEVDGSGTRTLGYNQPIFFDGLRRFVLLQGAVDLPAQPRFTDAEGGLVALSAEGRLGDTPWRLLRVSHHPSLRVPMVQLSPLQGTAPSQWLPLGDTTGDGLRFAGFETTRGLGVVVRRNDGIPVLLLSMLLFALGVGMFWVATTGPRPGP